MADSRPPSFWATCGLLCILPLAAAGLNRFGLKRCYGWVQRHSHAPMETGAADRITAESMTRWVSTVNRRYSIYAVSCLAESLVLVWLLRRKGIQADLVLGIRTLFGPLESHAWVSFEGRPLNDRPEVDRIYDRIDWDGHVPSGGLS